MLKWRERGGRAGTQEWGPQKERKGFKSAETLKGSRILPRESGVLSLKQEDVIESMNPSVNLLSVAGFRGISYHKYLCVYYISQIHYTTK